MPEWRSTTLGTVCHIEHGWPFKSLEYTDEAGYPIVTAIGNFDYSGGLRLHSSRINRYRGDYPSSFRLSPGDLLLVMTCQTEGGEILGIPGLVPDDAETYLHNQRIGRVVIDRPDEVDRDFLFQYARTSLFNRQLVLTATGSKILHTSPRRIESTVVRLPPLTEQRAIAEVLGALDDKLAANVRLMRAAHATAQLLASRTTTTVTLDAVAVTTRTMVDPVSLAADAVRLYSLPGFDAGGGPELVDPKTIKSGKFRITSPAVLVSKLNPRIPRIWEVPKVGDTSALASTEFVVLAPTSCSTALLWSLLAQPRFSDSLQSQVAGTSGSHQRVKSGDVLSAQIGDPATLPARVVAEIDAVVARAHAASAESQCLAATRDVLLPALMSGRLRVRDAERVMTEAL
ncbi:restriction endonuclease subunit S [Cellulomonas marina]|uniref:Type I restriction enzyme, S subunit n=1 Tax=Cellulomonas marina TaxID=988821 RepID=A0A1I1A7E6_9CELL|nr:restriction endonuclease subunit S [Cellulomonas marina]GIG29576.1 hypothetical protein Cma02nite_21760 [Cellulomonas marina]SFB33286.1 type I restriction enzyme, S subunit [Cellulomonas marina]